MKEGDQSLTPESSPTHHQATRILVSTFAYNEHIKIEKTIQRIFDANLEQAIPNSNIEVVLADDGSTDDFPERLKPAMVSLCCVTIAIGALVIRFDASLSTGGSTTLTSW